jgi:hypothetical protein
MSYVRHTSAPASFNDLQGLTPAKARDEMARRRDAAEALMESYRGELTANGTPPDYTLDGLVDIFVYMADKLRLELKSPLPEHDMPKWLRDEDKPFLDFDAQSVPIVIALGFYLGNKWIRNFEHLEWRISRKGMVYYGQPVVDTRNKVRWWAEMPVMMPADVMCCKYLENGRQRSSFSDPIALHIEDARLSLAAWRALSKEA